jgi:PAS domain S-box-containing protein
MADGAEAQVLDYLNYLKIQTSGYSTSKPIMDALKKRYHHTGNNKSNRNLNRYLAAGIKNFPECVEMFILDVNGRVIASSDTSNTGKDLSDTDYFLNGRKTVYVSNIFREEETGRITWLVACPVMDVRSNKLLAVLVSRINPVTLSDITTEHKIRALGAKSQALRIGKTGETYLVNRENLMITESRFLDDVILKQAVDTEIVRCTRKVSETKAGNYPDYRGIPVDGASMIIWETGWIIVSEMDHKESMIPFQRLLYLSLTGIGVLIPIIFFTSSLLSRRLTEPIMRLVQADREIIQGNPSHAFISDREIPADELGEVMHIRNIMLTSLKKNEEELRRQSEELQTIIDASPILIFYKDKENRFIRVNKALADLTGLPKEAIEGKTTFEIYPHYAEKYWEDDKEVILSGQPKTNIIEPVVLKGVTRWAQTDKIPYRDERGNIIGIIGFALDITERKQAEDAVRNERDKLIRVFEAMEDGVYIVNQRYEIEYVNPIVEKEFGLIEGRKCYEYFHGGKEVCPWCPNREVFAGKTVHWEWCSPKNQKIYDLVDTPLKNLDGSVLKLGIFRDITERKRMEEDLKRKINDLEQFRKVTIRREIRMRELKDRVEELEREIKMLRGM